MRDTAISWTDDTVNAWWGCTKISPACTHCYAESLSVRFGKAAWGDQAPRMLRVDAAVRELGNIAARGDREGRPRRVFLQSMSDLFEARPELAEARARVIDTLHELNRERVRLIPLLLTKRAAHMVQELARLGTPRGAWVGVTAEDQARADERIRWLMQVEGAAGRFVSMEPLLEPVTLRGYVEPHFVQRAAGHLSRGRYPLSGAAEHRRLEWIIVGGESGRGARPMRPYWVQVLRDQAVASGVLFHFKQWGEWVPRTLTAPEEYRDGMHVWARWLGADGAWESGGAWVSERVGTAAAGRILDGREWSEVPRG